MKESTRTYLVEYLAPVLSQRFSINLQEVEDVINTFDAATTSPIRKRTKTPVKKRGPTKDDLLKEARQMGLKVTTKMKKDEIQAKINDALVPRAQTPPPPPAQKTPPRAQTPPPPPAQKTPPRAQKTPKASRVQKSLVKQKKGSMEGKSFTSSKGTWTFGKLLGTGGFGAVYEVEGHPGLVIKTGSDDLKKNQDSGIFSEKAVYLKIRDPNGDKQGIPQVVDSGKLPKDLKNDYFLVIPKFEESLEQLIKREDLDLKTTNKIMNDLLSALKHMAEKGYIHLDIKPENVMLKDGRWYLIDYGVAEKHTIEKETMQDPKKAGNGTPWFMARDAHKGQMSRKADLESLVYTLMQMNKIPLPWFREKAKGEKDIDYTNYILTEKQKFFDDYKKMSIPPSHKTFIECVDKLEPGTSPKYDALKFK